MENIRLPEDFTDRVMLKIEQKERVIARRKQAIAIAGGILGGVALIAAAVIVLRYYHIDLRPVFANLLPDISTPDYDPSYLSGIFSRLFSGISSLFSDIANAPGTPVTGIVLAVFILACIGLWHDHRSRTKIHSDISDDTVSRRAIQ